MDGFRNANSPIFFFPERRGNAMEYMVRIDFSSQKPPQTKAKKKQNTVDNTPFRTLRAAKLRRSLTRSLLKTVRFQSYTRRPTSSNKQTHLHSRSVRPSHQAGWSTHHNYISQNERSTVSTSLFCSCHVTVKRFALGEGFKRPDVGPNTQKGREGGDRKARDRKRVHTLPAVN